MKKTARMLLSLLLCLTLLAGLFPAVLAEGDPPQAVEVPETTEEESAAPEAGSAPEETPEEPGETGSDTPDEPAEDPETQTYAVQPQNTGAVVDSGALGEELTWTLDDEGTLTVAGTGGMPDYNWNGWPWNAYRDRIQTVVIQDGVTSVGDCAFNDCYHLSAVTIPASVTSIGVNAFSLCTSMGTLTIPEGVTKIGWNAFFGCSSLTTVTIPASVRMLSEGVFSACAKLTEIRVADGNQACVSVDGVLFTADMHTLLCYPNGKPDDSYRIPDGVTEIGDNAFCQSNLKSVVLPDGLKNIHHQGFCQCSWLTQITLPDTVETIGNYAFSGCGLTEVTIPASVKDLTPNAFSGNPFAAYTVASGNSEYCAVDGVLFSKDRQTLVSYPSGKNGELYQIPDGVETVSSSAFEGTTALRTVTIPASVTEIGNYAFSFGSIGTVVFLGSAPRFSAWCFNGLTATVKYPVGDGSWTEEVRRDYYGNPTWEAYSVCIALQPESVSVKEGAQAVFSVVAVGEKLQYQWYYLKPGATSWTAVSAAAGKKASYSLTTAQRHDGYQYRCKVYNTTMTMYSEVAQLTLITKPVIEMQPASTTVYAGKTVTLVAGGRGVDLQYQWYYKTKATDSWKAVSGEAGKSASYQLTAEKQQNGYLYRCRIKNAAGQVFTDPVTLTVIFKPVIASQPESVQAYVGTTATFRVTANGSDLQYQWYYKPTPGSSWTAVKNNGTSAVYSLKTAERHNGYQYRCRVMNADGRVFSVSVKLTVCKTPVIKEQPASVTAAPNQRATFRVTADGAESYQWYYQKPGAASWTAVNAASGKSAAYMLTVAERHNGYRYRCLVKNAAGEVYSEPVTLTVQTFTLSSGDDAIYDASLGEYEALLEAAHAEPDLDRRSMLYAQAEAALLDAAVLMPYSGTDTSSFLFTLNLNRQTYALPDGACASSKDQQQKADAVAAMQCQAFRKALLYSIDKNRIGYSGRAIRNSFTPPGFVVLSKAVTDSDGHSFAAGSTYGNMLQYYLNRRGSKIRVDDGVDGWYDPAAAKTCLQAARSELGDLVSYPIHLDVVYPSTSEIQTANAQGLKESIESALGTQYVVVDLIPANNTSDYYQTFYSIESGKDMNADICFGTGWGADYQEPSTYLDTFRSDGKGDLTRIIGLY